MSDQNEEEKKVRVVKRRVKKAKSPIIEGVEEVLTSLFFDNILPAWRDMMFDAVSSGASQLIYGADDVNTNSRRGSRNIHTAYNAIRPSHRNRRREGSRRITRPNSDQIDDIFFDTRREAEDVLDKLSALLDDYEVIRVSDFYSAAGVSPNQTDRYYGWESIRDFTIRNSRDGYLIVAPRPRRIDI